MALASYTDANAWLDGTKIKFLSDVDAAPDAANADALILSFLAPVFPTHAPNWGQGPPSGEPVPEIVVSIAGRLMAAYKYARTYSEETDTPATYSSRLEREAMTMLESIVAGTLRFADHPEYWEEEGFAEIDFYPNDTTVVVAEDGFGPVRDVGDPQRAFAMEDRF